MPIDPATQIGPVRLTVADLDRARAFYERAVGLRALGPDGDPVRLGAPSGPALVELVGRPEAARRPPRSTGLFHLAILVPTRADLAVALERVVRAGGMFTGASDHLVSEALYLADPEGNGIEIYRDRPRDAWEWERAQLKMTTDPLDADALYEEGVPGLAAWSGLPGETIIGHIHLRVDHIVPAERFYCDELGMQLTTRYGDRASFVSLHGYHHHVAFNTWAGVGAPPPPPGSLGLREFALNIGPGTSRLLT